MTSVQAPASYLDTKAQKLLTHQPAVFEAVKKGEKFNWTPAIVAAIAYAMLTGISSLMKALEKPDLPPAEEPAKTESFEPRSKQNRVNPATHAMQPEARAYELVDALMREMNAGMLMTVVKTLPGTRPPEPDELALLAQASRKELRTAMCNIAKALYTDPDSASGMAKILSERLCALGWCGKIVSEIVPKECSRIETFMAAQEYLQRERDAGMPIDFTELVPENVFRLAKAQKAPVIQPPLTSAN